MVLLIDVGNSNIVFGIMNNNFEIVDTFRLKTQTNKTGDEYYLYLYPLLTKHSIHDAIISSVVPMVTSALINMLKGHFSISPKILGANIKTGLQLKADDPKSVGADLVCDCVAGLNSANEVLIIDLGTATKFIYAKDNAFFGVSIAPGVAISMKAMVSSAALLPSMELQIPKKVLNNSTIPCMQSGVLYGSASMVDGMIDRIRHEVGNPNIKLIATGGLSQAVIPLCKHDIEIKTNLVLEGLIAIYKKNL